MRHLATAALLLCCCAATVCAADGLRAIGNGRQLIDQDLSTAALFADGIRVDTMISLREDDKWYSGKAWIIQGWVIPGEDNDIRPLELKAFKGVYHIYASKDSNSVILDIGLVRRFTADPTRRIQWALDLDFETHGVEFEISLDENHRIPSDRIDMLLTRGFFVDKEGRETTKYYPPVGFSQKLAGHGAIRPFKKSEIYPIGEIFRALPQSLYRLDKRSPPGFLDRSRLQASKNH